MVSLRAFVPFGDELLKLAFHRQLWLSCPHAQERLLAIMGQSSETLIAQRERGGARLGTFRLTQAYVLKTNVCFLGFPDIGFPDLVCNTFLDLDLYREA